MLPARLSVYNVGSSIFPLSVDKALVVGPGHTPILAKLVLRIKSLLVSKSVDGRTGTANLLIFGWQVGGL